MLGRRLTVGVLAALFGVLALAATASASNRTFSVDVAPASVHGGATAVAMTATVSNLSARRTLGSANLRAPEGFDVSAAEVDRGTASHVKRQISLRDLSLDPGESAVVTMAVDTPACTGPGTWSASAKGTPDYSGFTFFSLEDDESSLTTTIVGGCHLAFSAEPEDTEKTQTISASPYAPAGAPVTVEVVDDDGVRVPLDGVTVHVGLGLAEGLGALSGTTARTTDDGVATFDDLAISHAGLYRLHATATAFTPDTSVPFTVVDDVQECLPGLACSTAGQNPRLRLDVAVGAGGSTGFQTLSLETGVRIDCTGYREFSGSWAVLDGPARTKTITYVIEKSELQRQTNRGARSLNMCFAHPLPFVQKPGTPLDAVSALFDFDGDGDLDPGYRGLLPDCGTAGATQCVSKRQKTGAGDGVIVVSAPAQAGDPAYRG